MSAETRVDRRRDDAPRTADVADALGVPEERLRTFVDYHPDPTPAAVLGIATADPAHEDLVAAWLEGRGDPAERYNAPDVDPRGLDVGGSD